MQGLSGAEEAIGTTVVIDTFRAFTTAAFAHAGGVGRHYLVATLDQARALKDQHPTALLCGEDKGVTPSDFGLGNSPAEILEADLAGRTLIQRTSAGTRCVLAALASPNATSVHPASLVVASATARVVGAADEVTLVASGRFGTEPNIEDDLTADFITQAVQEPSTTLTTAAFETAETVRLSDSARRLLASPWSHPDDVDLCLDVDRFDFALVATLQRDGSALVERIDSEPTQRD